MGYTYFYELQWGHGLFLFLHIYDAILIVIALGFSILYEIDCQYVLKPLNKHVCNGALVKRLGLISHWIFMV
jgi:hypothetical protein